MPGSTVENALKLYEFDRKLRGTLLQALQEVEVALATKIGYVLGKRAGDGYLRVDNLDAVACSRMNPDGVTAHEAWKARYEKLRTDAKEEVKSPVVV